MPAAQSGIRYESEGKGPRYMLHADPVTAGEVLVDPAETEPADAGRLLASEGGVDVVVHGGVVDVRHACLDALCETHTALEVLGEHTTRQTVGRVVGDSQRVLLVLGTDDRGHRAEDLLPRRRHLVAAKQDVRGQHPAGRSGGLAREQQL